jgi:hypothetical protein
MSNAKVIVCAVLVALFPTAARPAEIERSPGEIYRQTLQATAWVHTQKRHGTGWVADADRRLLVTNYHVIGSDESVTVVFADFRDGKLIA